MYRETLGRDCRILPAGIGGGLARNHGGRSTADSRRFHSACCSARSTTTRAESPPPNRAAAWRASLLLAGVISADSTSSHPPPFGNPRSWPGSGACAGRPRPIDRRTFEPDRTGRHDLGRSFGRLEDVGEAEHEQRSMGRLETSRTVASRIVTHVPSVPTSERATSKPFSGSSAWTGSRRPVAAASGTARGPRPVAVRRERGSGRSRRVARLRAEACQLVVRGATDRQTQAVVGEHVIDSTLSPVRRP